MWKFLSAHKKDFEFAVHAILSMLILVLGLAHVRGGTTIYAFLSGIVITAFAMQQIAVNEFERQTYRREKKAQAEAAKKAEGSDSEYLLG